MPSPALTVSPEAAEPLCRTELPKISLTSKIAPSPHGCPGPSTSPTNARAARARFARPASVTLSRTDTPAITAPALPRPHRPGNRPGSRRTQGHARSAQPRTSSRHNGLRGPLVRDGPLVRGPYVPAAPVRGRPCKADGPAHRSQAPIPVRYASVDTATQRPTALQGDTRWDREETARIAENSQLAGRFRRWWQVLGSNQHRLSRPFYRQLRWLFLGQTVGFDHSRHWRSRMIAVGSALIQHHVRKRPERT
jgi:hypothetical protein